MTLPQRPPQYVESASSPPTANGWNRNSMPVSALAVSGLQHPRSNFKSPAQSSHRARRHATARRSSIMRSRGPVREDLAEKLLDIKREKGWSWRYICGEIGGMSPVMIAGGVLGQQ